MPPALMEVRFFWAEALLRTFGLKPYYKRGAATAGTPGPYPWRLRQFNLNFYSEYF